MTQTPPDDGPLDDLEEFIRRHGHLPGPGRGPAEQHLYRWFRAVLAADIRVSHDTAVRVYHLADTTKYAYPVGMTDYRLADLEAFITRTGRFPRSDGIIAAATDERSLALWARQVRQGKTRVTAEIAATVKRLAQQHPPPPRHGKGRGWNE